MIGRLYISLSTAFLAALGVIVSFLGLFDTMARWDVTN